MAKRKEKVYREDCFGYISKDKCAALNKIKCENCNFYKTRGQYKAELLKYNGISDIEMVVQKSE